MKFSTILSAGEVKPFKLTDVEGTFAVRYFFDQQVDETETIREDGSTHVDIDNLIGNEIKEFEVNIQTRSFVYHPNFLSMDIGGGPVWVENASSTFPVIEQKPDEENSGIGEGVAKEALYNFNANLRFFPKKSYPFSFYVDRTNPLIVPRYDEHFLQENTKLGSIMALRNWALPINIRAEAFRLTSIGKGNIIVVDNEVDEFNIRMNQSMKFGGFRQLLLQSNRYKSKSGNITDDISAIEGTNVLTSSLNYDSRSVMGARGQSILTNTFTYVEQDFKPKLQRLKYSPELRWDHSKSLNSFYRADYIRNIQDDIETVQQSARVGYANIDKRYGSNSGILRGEQEISSGFQLDIYSLNLVADYAFDISYLTFNTHVGFGYSVYDQETKDTGVLRKAPSERFVLENGNSTRLKFENIVASTIVVYEDKGNSVKETELILGVNYTIEQPGDGTITYITHLIDPDPNNRYSGKVIVDYEYEPGGTFSYEKESQQYQVGIALSKYLSIFAGASISKNNLVEGEPQFALQDVDSRNYGIRFDVPIADFLTIGGDTRTEDERATSTPNLRISTSAYMQFRLFTSGFLQLSGQTTTVDYVDDDLLNDIDLVRYNVRFRSRPSRRTLMSLAAIGERDLASTIPRETYDVIFSWKWNYRKLYFSLDAKGKLDSQGTNDLSAGVKRQDRRLLRASLERRF